MSKYLIIVVVLLVISLLGNAFLLFQLKAPMEQTGEQMVMDQTKDETIARLEQELEAAKQQVSRPQTAQDQSDPKEMARRTYADFQLVTGEWVYGKITQKEDFTVGNATGSVIEVCESIRVVDGYLCLDNRSYILHFNDQYSRIASFAFEELGDESKLNGITLNTGSGIATSTERASATLLIDTNFLNCLWADGICIEKIYVTHLVQLPSGTSEAHSFDTNLFRLNRLVWNSSGTKAAYIVGCAEGCPPQKVIGIDLQSKTSQVLVEQSDLDQNTQMVRNISWVDDSTINADGAEFVFE